MERGERPLRDDRWRLVALIAAVAVPLGSAATLIVGLLDMDGTAESAVEVPLPDPGTPLTSDVAPASVLCDPPGCETWRFAARGRLDVAVSSGRDTVLVTSRPAGTLHALDAATGEELWRHEAPTNRHTQLLRDTVLLWTENELVALAVHDGEQRWAVAAPVTPHRPVYRLVRESGASFEGQHRVSDGWATSGPDPVAVLVGYRGFADREILFAIDLGTGTELWTVDDATATGLAGDRVLILRDHRAAASDPNARRAVAVLDARTGDELWSLPLDREGAWALPVGDGYVVVEAPDGQRLLDAATGETVVTLEVDGDDDGQGRLPPDGWWHAPKDVAAVIQVRDVSGEPAELVAYHLDGQQAWRRVLPVPSGAPLARACCVELRDGPNGALVARDGRAGPDALVVTLDATTGETRRVSMRIDPAAPLDPDGAGLPGGWWVATQDVGGIAGQHPQTGEVGWRLTTFGRQGDLRVAYPDPLLVIGPGELLRLPSPDDER